VYEYFEGRVATLAPGSAVLDVAGVGWLIHAPASTLRRLEEGVPARLLVHLAVSDSALTLYGFLTKTERQLFRRLLKVGGIGPTSALNLLSAMPPDDLARAILDGDLKRLTALKGVGKKTAERLIVELRDQLGAAGSADSAVASESGGGDGDDLQRVLQDLGAAPAHARTSAEAARSALGPDADFQELLRHALQTRT
jgi:Holliday junction DNA helicase RuvA